MRKHTGLVVLMLPALALLAACAPTNKGGGEMFGTLTGAVAGGIAGAQFGGGTGQLIGVGVGALAGAAAGGYVGAMHDQGAFAGSSSAPARPVSNINHYGMPAYAPTMGAYAIGTPVSSAYRQDQNFVPTVAYGQAVAQGPVYQVVPMGQTPAPYGCTYVMADCGHLVRYCADPYAGWYAAPK